MKAKKLVLLTLLLFSCQQKNGLERSRMEVGKCEFDYVIREETEINHFLAIQTVTLPKDINSIIENMDYRIRNEAVFEEKETKLGNPPVQTYRFSLHSIGGEQTRSLYIGKENYILDKATYDKTYCFTRPEGIRKIWDSVKPTLDRLISEGKTQIIG